MLNFIFTLIITANPKKPNTTSFFTSKPPPCPRVGYCHHFCCIPPSNEEKWHCCHRHRWILIIFVCILIKSGCIVPKTCLVSQICVVFYRQKLTPQWCYDLIGCNARTHAPTFELSILRHTHDCPKHTVGGSSAIRDEQRVSHEDQGDMINVNKALLVLNFINPLV